MKKNVLMHSYKQHLYTPFLMAGYVPSDYLILIVYCSLWFWVFFHYEDENQCSMQPNRLPHENISKNTVQTSSLKFFYK